MDDERISGLAWTMYASTDLGDPQQPLRHFGPLQWARLDRTARHVVQVDVQPVTGAEVTDECYWGWLDTDALDPCFISPSEQQLTDGFRTGQADDAPGPSEEQAAGQGRILRLRLQIEQILYERSTLRHAWTPYREER